eukprot:6182416-Pleurochrysis_carterae.AAC.1
MQAPRIHARAMYVIQGTQLVGDRVAQFWVKICNDRRKWEKRGRIPSARAFERCSRRAFALSGAAGRSRHHGEMMATRACRGSHPTNG